MNNKNISFLFALLVADALLDALFLSAILAPSSTDEDEDEDTYRDRHPLIGRRYRPMDNSYATDKETGIQTGGVYNKEFTIVSDPYKDNCHSFWGSDREDLFVDVFSNDSMRTYRVLFREVWLVDEE